MNTPHLPPHLTDEQLYNLLANAAPASDQHSGTHLHHCTQCQIELATLRSSLANLQAAATNLAVSQLPPLRSIKPSRPTAFAFRPYAFAATAATALVLFAGSLKLTHSHPAPVAPPAVQTLIPAESDAALLDGIQQDLSASVPPSLAPLEVTATTSPDRN